MFIINLSQKYIIAINNYILKYEKYKFDFEIKSTIESYLSYKDIYCTLCIYYLQDQETHT